MKEKLQEMGMVSEKMYKDVLIRVKNKNYSLCYKTKFGFIKEIMLLELIDGNKIEGGLKFYGSKEIPIEITKASTFKDWLKYKIYELLWNVRKNFGKKKR